MVQPNSILDSLARLVNELKLGSLDPQVNACRNQLLAGQGVEVAIFGRFKAGRSSFLNHLAGREVLPVGVVPLTAVITRVRFGLVERAGVRFQNGDVCAIPLAEIPLYVAERENPDNHKHVAAVEVELPDLRELAPLAFVDTPGLEARWSITRRPRCSGCRTSARPWWPSAPMPRCPSVMWP